MNEFVHANENVSKSLEDNFLIMKVTWAKENKNEDFLSGFPKVSAYPHIFVCESDGTFLHSQGTGELEEGQGYNEAKFMAFLDEWKPE